MTMPLLEIAKVTGLLLKIAGKIVTHFYAWIRPFFRDIFQRRPFTMFSNPNKVNLTDESTQLTFRSIDQQDFNNFYNLSQPILKKGHSIPVLANHRKELFD